MSTKLYKNAYDSWTAETYGKLPEGQEFKILTMKRHSGELTTTLGGGKTDGLAWVTSHPGGLNETLVREQIRCTKKAVELQHASIDMKIVEEKVRAFYKL